MTAMLTVHEIEGALCDDLRAVLEEKSDHDLRTLLVDPPLLGRLKSPLISHETAESLLREILGQRALSRKA